MASTPTVRELKQELKQLGVKSPPKARKAELVALVEDARPRPMPSPPAVSLPPPHRMRTVDLAPLLDRVREEVKRAPPDIKTAPALAEFLKKGRLESRKTFERRVLRYSTDLVNQFKIRVLEILMRDAYPKLGALWALLPTERPEDLEAYDREFRDRTRDVYRTAISAAGAMSHDEKQREGSLRQLEATADQYELVNTGAKHGLSESDRQRLAEMNREISALRRGPGTFIAEANPQLL
jgi:hypothetical protein